MGRRRNVSHLLGAVVMTCAALVSACLVASVGVNAAGAQAVQSARTAHVTATVAGTYVPLAPSRITDTRAGSGYPNAGTHLGAGGSINVQVTGVGAVPSSGVTAVVVNVTVVGPTASSYVTVFPEGTTQPVVSNLNFTAGETLANLATVPLGARGADHLQPRRERQRRRRCRGLLHHGPQTSGLYNPVNPVRVLGSLRRGCVHRPGRLDSGDGRRGGRRAGRRVRRGGQRHRSGIERAGIPHVVPRSGIRYTRRPRPPPT